MLLCMHRFAVTIPDEAHDQNHNPNSFETFWDAPLEKKTCQLLIPNGTLVRSTRLMAPSG